MARALVISLRFPRDAYSGGELGMPEELPSPARVHAAFAGAAAGGPDAHPEGRVLVADDRHRRAVEWFEAHTPLGVRPPRTRRTDYDLAVRYRLRAAVDHPNETAFEPMTALDGPVAYMWPVPDAPIVEALRELASEITYVGRADSTVIASVAVEEVPDDFGYLLAAPGRGPGRALRVATSGRFAALVAAHRRASVPDRHHRPGSRGRQAADEPVENAGDEATVLQRFAPAAPPSAWPFAEVWRVPVAPALPRWVLRPERRVAGAVAVHRALVAAIGSDVPAFVTGRDGDGPRRGAGHLAVHVTAVASDAAPTLVLALPTGVHEADRVALLDALSRRPGLRLGGRSHGLGLPTVEPARPFWRASGETLRTEVPMVLDTPGPARGGGWTLDDAVVCSVGYALRGVLEAEGLRWGTGWAFRRSLVAHLRSRGVEVATERVLRAASRYVHRARAGDLLVAAHATVVLGSLAPGGGFLALGRARHLGGGLLRPAPEVPR